MRLAVLALLLLAGLSFAMAAYSLRIAGPAEASVMVGDLIDQRLAELGGTFSLLSTDGVVWFYGDDGRLVGRLDLAEGR